MSLVSWRLRSASRSVSASDGRRPGAPLAAGLVDRVAAQGIPAFGPSAAVLVASMGLLATVRPLLRARNYLLYSAIMTPLVVLIMDAGRPPEGGVPESYWTSMRSSRSSFVPSSPANSVRRPLLSPVFWSAGRGDVQTWSLR